MHDDSTSEKPGRQQRIEQIVSALLQLDQAWAHDVCHRDWDATSGLSRPAHAAAAHTAIADEQLSYIEIIVSAANGTNDGADHLETHNRYSQYVSIYSNRLNDAACAYPLELQHACDNYSIHADDFDQAAADVVLGHAVGCISRNRDAPTRIVTSLHFAGSHGALDKILEGIDQLTKACDTWRQPHDQVAETKDCPPDVEVSSTHEEDEKGLTTDSASTSDEQDIITPPTRAARIHAIVSGLLALDRAWAQDVCSRTWTRTSCLSQPVHAAARTTAHVSSYHDITTGSEQTFFPRDFPTIYQASLSASKAAQRNRHRDPYHDYISTYSDRVEQAADAYTNAIERARLHHRVGADDFNQGIADVVLGHAVGCISRGKHAQHRIKKSLQLAGDDGALDKILEAIEHLTSFCTIWKQQHSQEAEEKEGAMDYSADSDTDVSHEDADSIVEEKTKDGYLPSDAATSQSLLTAALCGAIACGAGMVLPLLWGAAVPWALVLTGACVGGVLGYRAALSQPSVSQMAWMLMGWAAMGLGASVASWGVLPLVVNHGIALAVGVGATALCLGGLGSLWSQGIRIATRGNSAPPLPAPHARTRFPAKGHLSA